MRPWALLRHSGWVLIAGFLAYAYVPSLTEHAKLGMDPLRFHDDVRIHIWPYFRYTNPDAFQDDYLGDYAMDAFMPIGFRVLYTAGAYVWDPEPLSKVLPYVLLVVLLALAGIGGHAFGKKPGAFVAMTLVLSSSLYLDRMGGGLSRAFAYPAIAACLVTLVYGRVRWASWTVFAGAAFYPMAGVIMGFGLAACLLLPASSRGEAEHWSLRRRLRHLGFVGGVSFLILLPMMITEHPHGPKISYLDVARYPESGPGGTLGVEDLPPYKPLSVDADFISRRVFYGAGDPLHRGMRRFAQRDAELFHQILLVLLFVGWWRLAKEDPRARRLLAFLAGVAAAHTFSVIAAPHAYSPSRYVHYGLPPILILLPAGAVLGLLSLSKTLVTHRPIRDALAVIPTVLFVFYVGGHGTTDAGYSVHVTPEIAPVYRAIASLPPGAMIAGWPTDYMSNVPYVSRRRAFMTGEMHMPHHAKHLDEVRRRLRPLFEAYLADTPEPLRRLRDEQGVTHMFVDLQGLQAAPPGYMEPMGTWIREITRKRENRPYQLQKELGGPSVIIKSGRWVLFDLSKIGAT
jgi:hypothetical protein